MKSYISLLLIVPFLTSALVRVNHLVVRASGSRCTLQFRASGSYHYHSFLLKNPDRFVVDLYHVSSAIPTYLPSNLCGLHFLGDRVYRDNNPLRVIFGIKSQFMSYDSVERNNGVGYSLNFHFKKGYRAHLPSKMPAPKIYNFSRSHLSALDLSHLNQLLMEKQKGKVVVVIDPGHGGKDPGATGPDGAHEKTIVLTIAKDLAADLNKTPGFEATLTRVGDYYVPLRGRLKIARDYHADFFVSIHADAFRVKSAEGASVYALSLHGATSESAHWLAHRENLSELRGGVDLGSNTNDLNAILLHMSQSATIAKSIRIGHSILTHLSHVVKLHHGGHVEQAAFVVLKSPDIPSLLIETGFLSNKAEEAHLINHAYQHKLAKAVALGIADFYQLHPLQHVKKLQYYHVVSGDTLYTIAQRFGTTVRRIKKVNHLTASTLTVGQRLSLP